MPRPRREDPANWNPLLAGELRAAHHEQYLGRAPVCQTAGCSERRPSVLYREGSVILCYECRAARDGRPRLEIDHPLGRHAYKHHTVTVPANDNQVFNDPDAGPEARLRWLLDRPTEIDRILRRIR